MLTSRSTSVRTRSSIPSYRPQTMPRCEIDASSRASGSLRRSPAGSIRTTVAPAARSGSTAANSGSGRITMPAPPPYGESSTERCRPRPCSRRSWTPNATSPDSAARPTIEVPSGPAMRSGKMVTTSIRIGSADLFGFVGSDHQQACLEVDAEHGRAKGRHQALTPVAHDAVDLVRAGSEDLHQLAHERSIGLLDAQPDEVVPVEGVGREVAGRGLEIPAGQRFRGVT